MIGTYEGGIVDADVHANIPSLEVLTPYLEQHWIEWIDETGFEAPPWLFNLYPPGAPTTVAPKWIPEDGRSAASEVDLLREHVLEPIGVETAIVNCYWGIESIRHPDFGAALASAVNDWLIAEWLDREPRLRASICVNGLVPADAASEIDRVGSHPGFVQVFLPVRSWKLYGNRIWYPMFEAMERNALVAGIHYGGTPDGPPTPTGWPAFFLEEYVGHIQVFQAQLLSLVGEGAFEKFPSLRFAFLEGGFTWLGPWLWRMDKEWKGLRREIPWVKQLPSETVRERVRFSVRPLDAGPPEEFKQVVGWLESDDLLMFCTDYPHGYDDDIADLLDVIPQEVHEKVMAGNARAWYRL
jgi:hypothetical protein